MASIKFSLDTRRADKAARFPLKLLVCHNQKNTVANTGVYLIEAEWDDKNQRVTTKHRENKSINGDLTILYGKYAKIIKDQEKQEINHAAISRSDNLLGAPYVGYNSGKLRHTKRDDSCVSLMPATRLLPLFSSDWALLTSGVVG